MTTGRGPTWRMLASLPSFDGSRESNSCRVRLESSGLFSNSPVARASARSPTSMKD